EGLAGVAGKMCGGGQTPGAITVAGVDPDLAVAVFKVLDRNGGIGRTKTEVVVIGYPREIDGVIPGERGRIDILEQHVESRYANIRSIILLCCCRCYRGGNQAHQNGNNTEYP